MESEIDKDQKLAALCRRLGKLWSNDVVVKLVDKLLEEKLKECNLTLLEKLYSRPNVNFQAFLSMTRKAWKLEDLVCDQVKLGLFIFTFTSKNEKRRVLEASPWSFSSNLLKLQQLNPKIPIYCHDFTHGAFWVQFLGLPLAMINENMLREVVAKLGKVLEVKMDSKVGSLCKVGQVRAFLDLLSPLKAGMLVNFEEEQFWIDFKYERLPRICYLCGRIGHYNMSCENCHTKNLSRRRMARQEHGLSLESTSD
ncbi:hypothetical protein EUGRSUZ_C02001 [Eucalyptus grandis]|uniref:Uncharacterized protein n=2 Tax=Eucalyptus grandis TaxID=71139 RepID=A0ACC3LEP4_EUCGR|nr:hypothetical protein EUGRSUZ_C02001 [Eucalyptus grandis]